MSEIEMTPVESSNLEAVGYDADAKVLRVQFKNLATYEYANVPPEAYAGLMGAKSKGAYLASIIKPNYTATKQPVEPAEQPAESEPADRDMGTAEAW